MTTTRPGTHVTFGEVSAGSRTASVPLSHVSVELGHFYQEDYEQGREWAKEQFRRVAPWLATVRQTWQASVPGGRARVSTCFLIDDYFGRMAGPREVITMILEAAAEADLTVDYIARESACAQVGGVDIARLVADHLVAEPTIGSNGSRPPVTETGWLCNGARSPATRTEAMGPVTAWQPPLESARQRHSIFVDVELWDEGPEGRTWSCAYLAAVWQLLRLGLIRDEGRVPVSPEPLPAELPESWAELPGLMRVNPAAMPFSAYTTLSILSHRLISIELAVRTIINQIAVDAEVRDQVDRRSADEDVEVAEQIVNRVRYFFT